MGKSNINSQFNLSLDEWIELAKDDGVRKRIAEDPYSEVYPILLKHFSRHEPLGWDDVIVGLHLVYGWMPTIPKLKKSLHKDIDRDSLVALLEKVRAAGDVPDAAEMELIARFTNNSVIGASKLVHFLNPTCCPIWDTRVAQVMIGDSISFGAVNNAARWHEYTEILTSWKDDPSSGRMIEDVRGIRGDESPLTGCSSLRLVELVLFHAKPSSYRCRKPVPPFRVVDPFVIAI